MISVGSEVQILPGPPRPCYKGLVWGCSSAGRAPALQAGGRRFEPDHLHSLREWGPGRCPGPVCLVVTVEIRVSGVLRVCTPLGGGMFGVGGVRPGDRTRGLCQCESGSGASLGALPGGYGSTAMFFEAASLTGTCMSCEGCVAASGSSVSVQRRVYVCAEFEACCVAGFSASVCFCVDGSCAGWVKAGGNTGQISSAIRAFGGCLGTRRR